MVGDSVTDVQAGQAAKMVTVGAIYGFAPVAVAEANPNHLIYDIADMIRIVLG